MFSLIAQDVLVMQISAIVPESSFNTSGHVLDPFSSSLCPKMVEAFMCTLIEKKEDQDYLSMKEDFYIIMDLIHVILMCFNVLFFNIFSFFG